MASAAPTNGISQSYAQDLCGRYAQTKDVDGSKNALNEDVLSRYNSAMRQSQILIHAQNPREIQISRSNHVSTLLHEQTEYITYLRNLMDANPFIVVVVDGNDRQLRLAPSQDEDQDQEDGEAAVEG